MGDTNRSLMRVALSFLLCLAGLPALAQVGPSDSMRYALAEGSTYQKGCFGPCACPIIESGTLEGSFILTFAQFDPLYTWYDVSDVDWTAALTNGMKRTIKGDGTYRIGGEVALVHELSLDLTFDGDGPQHLTSGLVSGGGNFPAIETTISIPGAGCMNTVIHVVAKPTTHLSISDETVDWQELPMTPGYDVVMGSLGTLRQTHGNFKTATLACVADEATGNQVGYTATPGPGQGWWILVRPDGGSWDEGSSTQVGSRDAEIDASPAGCP